MGQITRTFVRKDGVSIYTSGSCAVSVEAAAQEVVESELARGGRFVEVLPWRVAVETAILHKLDRTVFEGDPEAMRPLICLALLWAEVVNDEAVEDKTAEGIAADAAKALGDSSDFPLPVLILEAACARAVGNAIVQRMAHAARIDARIVSDSGT